MRLPSGWSAVALAFALVTCLGVGGLRAQTARAAGIQNQIRKLEAELDKVAHRQRRLTHLRMRHLLGLPMRSTSEDPVRLTPEQQEIALLPTLVQDRDAALAQVETSVRELKKLSSQLEAIAPDRVLGDRSFAAPAGETAAPRGRPVVRSVPSGIEVEDPFAERYPDEDPVVEGATPGDGEGPDGLALLDDEPTGDVVLIDGSADGSLVGRTLLEAGSELLRQSERLLAAGRPERAEELRKRGIERIERARTALRPFADAPPKQNLAERFFLARAEEQLGDLAAAYRLYLHVHQHDAPNGRWGEAADFASSVMRWRDDLRAFQPDLDIRVPWRDGTDHTGAGNR